MMVKRQLGIGSYYYYRLLSRLSIRNKIMVVCMAASFFAMTFASSIFVFYQYSAFQDWLVQNITSQAEVIARNSSASLAFDDPKGAEAILQSLQAVSSITGAILFREDGAVFAKWQREGSADFQAEAPDWRGDLELDGNIYMALTVSEKEMDFGTILLRSNQKERLLFLRNSLIAMFILVFLAGGVTLLLSTKLLRIITEPVANLAKVMKQVSKSQDYGLRALRFSEDEIGDLTNYFNNMLTQVESRDRQLSEREELLQSIINNTNSVIYLKDISGRYLMVNRRFKEVLLLKQDTIIGSRAVDLYPADIAEKLVAMDEQVMATGQLMEAEEVVPHRDGPHTYISSKFPLLDSSGEAYALCGISTDITKRKQDEEELGHLRNYLHNVIDSMPSVLVGLDTDGRVTRWNREAEKLSGMTFAQVKGDILADIMPQFAKQMTQVKTAIRERRVLEVGKLSYHQDGITSYKDVTIYPLVANGIEGAVMRVDDITERVQIEEMMVQTEKMMSVGGLAAGMAHEINNPLGIMIQAVQNIKRRVSSDLPANIGVAKDLGISLTGIQAYLEKRMVLAMVDDIHAAGSRAARIVANMLQFSRRSESARQYAQVAELIDQTVELAANDYDLKKKYDFRHITIVREYDPAVQEVKVVVTEFEQVILNLLKNAAQAFADKVMAEGEEPTITLRVSPEGGFTRIEVSDNGPGIPEEVRKRVFEPFFTTKPVGRGTGLGLSVSYMIITNNHGGTMEVESTPGKGAVFILRLPNSKEPEGKSDA